MMSNLKRFDIFASRPWYKDSGEYYFAKQVDKRIAELDAETDDLKEGINNLQNQLKNDVPTELLENLVKYLGDSESDFAYDNYSVFKPILDNRTKGAG